MSLQGRGRYLDPLPAQVEEPQLQAGDRDSVNDDCPEPPQGGVDPSTQWLVLPSTRGWDGFARIIEPINRRVALASGPEGRTARHHVWGTRSDRWPFGGHRKKTPTKLERDSRQSRWNRDQNRPLPLVRACHGLIRCGAQLPKGGENTESPIRNYGESQIATQCKQPQ
jgi:hypothetical protein